MAKANSAIVLTQSGIVLEVTADKTTKYSATIVLSKSTLSFEITNGDKFNILLENVKNIQFYQPIFGASYISALWAGEGTFSITFKEGGGAACFEKISELSASTIGDPMLSASQATDSKCKKMQ